MSAVLPITADPRFRISTATAGQTSFTVPFPFQDNSDIAVARIDGVTAAIVPLIEGVHYALTGAGSPSGGTVTLLTGAKAGDRYLRLGSATLARVMAVTRAGKWRSRPVDDDFDRALIIAQELRRDIGQAVRVGYDVVAPTLTPGASGQVLAFNDLGNLVGIDPPVNSTAAKVAVATRTQLKALNPLTTPLAQLTEPRRAGDFVWRTGNYAALVDADTAEGIYIPANGIASASGAWVRVFDGPLYATWFGADPTYSVDSAPAVKVARALLEVASDYRGGTLFFPAGRYKLNSTIAFTAYNLVHNIWIKGEGPIATTLDFSGAPAGSDGITFNAGAHFGVSDLMITGARNDAISVNPALAPGDPAYAMQFIFSNLRLQQGVRHGLKLVNAYMGKLSRIWSTVNGGYGFVLAGFHTSLDCDNCFASSNSGAGWSLNGLCYSTFVTCGSDLNVWGYAISNVNGVSFVNCGAESNSRDAFLLFTSNASAAGLPSAIQNIKSLSFIDCFALDNGTAAALSYSAMINASTADNRPISYRVDGGTSYVHTAGDGAFINQAGSGSITADVCDHITDGLTFDTGPVTHNDRIRSLDLQAATRPKLTANRTYYVRSDGSDANTGLANTAGGAFLTLLKAWTTLCGLDLNGYTATVQIADGTYTAGIVSALSPIGGPVVIQGNSGTPANVLISTTSADCFAFSGALLVPVTIKDLKLQTTTAGNGLNLSAPGILKFGNIVFGAAATYHVQAANAGARIQAISAYTVAGAATCHAVASDHAQVQIESLTVTINGTPAFTYYYLATRLGEVMARSMTYSGSATGARYSVDANALLHTGTATGSVPGNSAGSTTNGGQAL